MILDNNNYFLSIFIDLQKAFDVINHSKLLKKMSMYGIRGVAHHWLSSYLENRNQYVHINDTKSELWQIKCGVPQGSILGPKLFTLYMNDFAKVSNLGKILFADDTTLFHSGKSIQEVTKVVNEELEVIKHWFDLNGLILNAKKTNFMLFNNKKEKVKVKLEIDGVEIHRVRETKFLGVMIDDDLKWKSHINYTKGKIGKAISVLHRVKFFLNSCALLTLYNTMILPYLMYCVEVWGTTCKTYLQTIFILQKRAIRIITNSHYREPSNPLFIKLKVLKFPDIVDLSILKIMYKAKWNLLPVNLQNIFEIRTRRYNLKGTDVFKKPRFRTKIKERNIVVKGVNLWDALKQEIKECKTIITFKKHIKNSILEKYVNEN
uniref:Reverse transcriptase domain-containing protein n=1 Tax=Salarias fasciatus TaxID=181472 RepID=A0A672FF89_SALFA